jgi:glycosyltransferase involved in cell wall biosynthesis
MGLSGNPAKRAAQLAKPAERPPLAVTWTSNAAFAGTGYGTQTRQVVSRMIRDGHAVQVAANYGLEGIITEWEGIPHLPRGYDGYSRDVLAAYYTDLATRNPSHRAYLFTLYDAWIYDHEALKDIPIVSWVPVDHMPIPEKVAKWCRHPNVTTVAMSRYGSVEMGKAGIDHTLIPHGIETDIFKPTPQIESGDGRMVTARQVMGVDEERFAVGIVNANKGGISGISRKAFGEQVLAFSLFAQDKPDALLYLHTEITGAIQGVNFDPLLRACDIRPEQVRWVNQYQYRTDFPAEALAATYTGIDVLLAATLGEGFGLTVAEYSATGGRAIVSNFTSQPELIVDGWLVDGQPMWDPGHNAWFCVPSVPSMVKALNEAYERRDEGRSDKARQHIVDHYDAETLYREAWRPFLASLA